MAKAGINLVRRSVDFLGPVISQASVLEMEKMEKDLERESR